MSESIFLAGKRGSGKSLTAAWMAAKCIGSGRAVATNLNLYVEHLVPAWCETRFYRVPDFPTAVDLHALPLGNRFLKWVEGESDPVMLPGYRESANGLLILDEIGTFLNSREWQGNGRQEVINWLLQSRKYGWDMVMLAQHANLADKQIRDSLIETQGTLRRLDKIKVPVLSSIYKYFTGETLHFPRMHFASLRYGFAQGAPAADSLFFRGTEFYKGYDTLQRISSQTGQQGLSTMLSAYDMKGRYMNKWDLRRQMAAGGLVMGLLIGAVGGYAASFYKPSAAKEAAADVVETSAKVRGSVRDDTGREIVLLSDGRSGPAVQVKADKSGVRYLVGGKWYGAQP